MPAPAPAAEWMPLTPTEAARAASWAAACDERSFSAVIAHNLATFTHDAHAAGSVVDKFQGVTRDRRRRHSNDNFLAKLAEAEKLNPYQPPAPAGPSYVAPPPIPMAPPPQAAPEPAPPPEPPPAAAKKSRQKRLSKEGARVAAEAFWEGDVDASSTIDQEEWKKLVLAKPELTRQMSVTLEEAFARADQDGNGTLELGEFLKTKEARRIAEAAEAAHAAEGETRCYSHGASSSSEDASLAFATAPEAGFASVFAGQVVGQGRKSPVPHLALREDGSPARQKRRPHGKHRKKRHSKDHTAAAGSSSAPGAAPEQSQHSHHHHQHSSQHHHHHGHHRKRRQPKPATLNEHVA